MNVKTVGQVDTVTVTLDEDEIVDILLTEIKERLKEKFGNRLAEVRGCWEAEVFQTGQDDDFAISAIIMFNNGLVRIMNPIVIEDTMTIGQFCT